MAEKITNMKDKAYPFDILNAVNVNEHTETKDTGKVKLTNTLYQVATMRAHFELLKQAIMGKLELDYYGKDLRLSDSSLIVEIMWLIAPDDMTRILEDERAKKKAQAKKAQEEKSNG